MDDNLQLHWVHATDNNDRIYQNKDMRMDITSKKATSDTTVPVVRNMSVLDSLAVDATKYAIKYKTAIMPVTVQFLNDAATILDHDALLAIISIIRSYGVKHNIGKDIDADAWTSTFQTLHSVYTHPDAHEESNTTGKGPVPVGQVFSYLGSEDKWSSFWWIVEAAHIQWLDRVSRGMDPQPAGNGIMVRNKDPEFEYRGLWMDDFRNIITDNMSLFTAASRNNMVSELNALLDDSPRKLDKGSNGYRELMDYRAYLESLELCD